MCVGRGGLDKCSDVLQGRRGLRAAGEAAGEDALEGVLEGLPEVPVEVCVDEGVEGGVKVADPEEDGDDHLGAVARVAAKRRYHVPETQQKKTSLRFKG